MIGFKKKNKDEAFIIFSREETGLPHMAIEKVLLLTHDEWRQLKKIGDDVFGESVLGKK